MRSRLFILVCLALSLVIMAVAASLGPSALVAPLGSHGPFLYVIAHPSRRVVLALSWISVFIGAAGVVYTLWTSRVRAIIDPRILIGAGIVCVVVYALMPPIGSTDILDYAFYGHVVHIDKNPYIVTVLQLRQHSDPVARWAPVDWQRQTDVYGPVATGVQWFAAWLGGSSMALIVFVLKWINAIAFIATALLVDRLAGPDPVRRVRAAALFTVNPVMLVWLVGSGHTDLLAALPLVGAIYMLTKARGPWLLFLGGVLAGVGAAVKISYIFPALGLILVLRHPSGGRRRIRDYRFREVAPIGAGVVLATGVAYALAGSPAVHALSGRLSRVQDDYLPFPHALLHHPTEYSAWIAVLTLICLAVLWFRYPSSAATPGGLDLRPALMLAIATTIVGPIQFPWYDAIFMPLLAITLAGPADLWLYIRGLLLTIATLPGVYHAGFPLRLGLRWVLLAYLVAFAVFCLFGGGWSGLTPAARAKGDAKDADDPQADEHGNREVQPR